MPVPEQTPVNSYTGNGVATTFAYTYKIFANADLKVTVDGVLKTLTTHYTITGVGQSGGGNVVFVDPPAAAAAIVIYREIAYKRDTDYVEGGDFLASTVDDDMDRAIMLIQQLKNDKNRSIKVPMGETTDQVITEVAAARANKLLGFDAAGALLLRTIADLGGAYTIGDGLQLVGLDIRAAADIVRTAIAKTIIAQHTFNPAAPGAPFIFGANAIGQLIAGLNADKVDGYEGNVFPQTSEVITDFVVSGLLGVDPGASLEMTIPGGTAYVIGKRVVKAGADADLTRVYTASKDTYVDISNIGAITYSEVNNGAGAPAVAASSIRLMKVVTDGAEITGVTDLRALKPHLAGSSANLVQEVYTEYMTHSSNAATIPHDDTIPQITEGTEFFNCVITPKDVNNLLDVDVLVWLSAAGADYLVAALFQDAVANALVAGDKYLATANTMVPVPLKLLGMVAGTTNPITFRVRSGCNGGTVGINGSPAGRFFGGVCRSSIRVRERTA